MRPHREDLDAHYLTTMNEVLTEVVEFAERARNAQDDVQMCIYLKMTSKAVECALRIYADRLAQNRVETQHGEKAK